MKSALQAPSLCVGPETTVITVICAHAKINRGWLDRVFLNRGWLDRSSEQTTAPLYERRAEDQISLESIDWSLEDHDLQEPPFSSSLEVLPPEDQQAQSPPAPTYKRKRLESDLEPVGERSDGQERQKRRKSSFEKLPSLHLSDQSSSSGQGQKGEDQTAAAIDESFIIGRKRKQSFLSTPPTSSINVAENHLPIGAEEEPDLPMIKKRRTESLEKLLSLKSIKWSSSDQGTIYERQAKDHVSLQSIPWSVEDLESLSSDPEDHPPADQQVQSPPASTRHSPVSPASARNSRVDLTTEDDILSRYEIGKMLGEGGNGCVYEGKRLEDGLEVAVKFASKSSTMKYISVPGHPAPIPLEIGLLLLVNMESKVPEIIQLLDWQDQPERYIMVLERPSPCKDLWDYALFQGGFLSEDTARVIMAQATKAAYMCCQRGVFHRDIKLENLLINTETLKVIMLLAQINQSADFQHEGDAQEVTLCLAETVGIADGDQSMDTVSLQAVTLADGSTAYIPHNAQDTYEPNTLQAVQLEDGSTAYIHHAVQVSQPNTILAIQTNGTVEDLHADATIDQETINALEQYTTKIEEIDSYTNSELITNDPHSVVEMQIVLQGQGIRRNTQPPGEKCFRCNYEGCGKLYTTANHLKVHERAHTGDKPYCCDIPGCGKKFATGERPYVCTVPGCDKRFTEYSSLYKHNVVHTPCKPYKCNHCGKTYKQISTLVMHKRTAHNDSEPIEEESEGYFEPPSGWF
ncbi:zinc finger protein 143-like [Labeo rohita]|uniref:non-specific serine/threonine protein kinase n=1 Tax=Labeo rohita TaxID=84645 RepID=A0A498LUQ1_LABRO|nr:zinc finger protein 143-like [Labeo rohita]